MTARPSRLGIGSAWSLEHKKKTRRRMKKEDIMQTDKIRVASNGSGREQALLEAEKYAQYEGLGRKEALQLRLLTEETLGMVTAIAGDFDADFWIENAETGVCRLHLIAKTAMNSAKKKELVAVSTTGRNEAAKGFMGRIRELIENSLILEDDATDPLAARSGANPAYFATMGMCEPDIMAADSMLYLWSLERYREAVAENQETSQECRDAWDELEKSIVASIADNVLVSVSGKTVELIIEKNSF